MQFIQKKKQEKLKISKEDIDGIRKLWIISHSFDENIEQNFQDKEKEQSLNNDEKYIKKKKTDEYKKIWIVNKTKNNMLIAFNYKEIFYLFKIIFHFHFFFLF